MKVGIAIEPIFRYIQDEQEVLEILISEELSFKLIEVHAEFGDKYLPLLLKKFNVKYTIHAPHMFSKEEINFCSENKKDIEKARFWLKKSINLAKQLNSKFIILHPDLPVNCQKHRAKEILYDHIKYGLRLINKNQMILIENMPSRRYTLSKPKEIKDFVSSLKSSRVGCVWDIPHSKLAMGNKYLEFPKILRNKIKEVHISDIKNKKDHLPLGKGNLNIKEVIKNLKDINYKGDIILEILSGDIYHIKKSKDILMHNI